MLRVELDKFYQKQCVNVASNSEWLEITRLFSRYLVCRYPLDSYFFNLFMEEVVEVGGEVSNDDLVLRLTETLSTWNKDKHVNIAFSIWYLISLLYKKQIDQYPLLKNDQCRIKCLQALKTLIDKYWELFKKYPLAWEVKSRWEKRAGLAAEALQSDKYAISHVNGEYINHALLISYVSTLCRILRDPKLTLQEIDIESGKSYINRCIWERPNYGGKYNLLRARLTSCIAEMKFQRGLMPKIDYIRQLVDALNDVAEARKKEGQSNADDCRNSADVDWQRCRLLQEELETKIEQMSLPDKYVPHSETGRQKNTRNDISKPMEDYYRRDDQFGIYIVMDGVTRPHDEYIGQGNSSLAFKVAKGVADNACSLLKGKLRNGISLDCSQVLKVLEEVAATSTKSVITLCQGSQYVPCAVGIISIILNGRFYFIAMGDCVGVLLRGKSRLSFGTQSGVEALSKMNVSKDIRYSKYLNKKIENGYAVFNGDDSAISVASSGSFVLEKDDVIILGTDGIKNYLKFADIDELRTYGVQKMLQDSSRYDIPPFAKYADDKVVIRIGNEK